MVSKLNILQDLHVFVNIHVFHVLHVLQSNYILGSDGTMSVHFSLFNNGLQLMHDILEFIVSFEAHFGLHVSHEGHKVSKFIDLLVEPIDLDVVFLLFETGVFFLEVLFPVFNTLRHLLSFFFGD